MRIDDVLSSGFVATASLAILTFCGVFSTLLFYVMRRDVNSRLPREEWIRGWGGTTFLYMRLYQLHTTMYPRTRLRTVMGLTIVVGIASFVVFVFAMVVRS